MSFAPMPQVQVKTSYIKVKGTIDLVTPALQIPAGVAIDSGNFVPEITGGAKRIGGYERYDGRASPSEQTYWVATVNTTSLLAVGNVITGATSAKTATVIFIESPTVAICTRNSGAFTDGEVLNVGGIAKATLVTMLKNATSTPLLNVTYTALAADHYRASIAAVPGEGPILGVWNYLGQVVAFRNNVGSTAAAMFKATASGWVQVTTGGIPTLVPGGRYEFLNYNFTGAATGMQMYGCDGKNKAFSWDGNTYTQLTTTGTPETPHHIAAHKNRLFLSINGSVFISAPANPSGVWVAASGAGEIGVGEKITAMTVLPGDNNTGALAIYGRNKTSILYGGSTATWNLGNAAVDSGCIEYTAQYTGAALALDDRGVTNLKAVQAFGNFTSATVSKPIQPLLERRVGLAAASSVLRSQDQYRLYFTDGAGLAFRVSSGDVSAVMPFSYPNPVTSICSGENTAGVEVVYFGSTNGMVYQAEKGTSFDGAAIPAWLRLAFNAEGGPTINKKWRRAIVETRVTNYVSLSFAYDMDYGDGTLPIVASRTINTAGGGGYWDQLNWDAFTWDAQLVGLPKFSLSGTSQNLSLLFGSSDALSLPYTIQSVVLHYTPRRLKR